MDTDFKEKYDVVVVGSGAGGLLAALRATDLGLHSVVLEKELRYGGTSATSGGFVWIPNHGRIANGDSREAASAYLANVCRGSYRQDRVDAYLDNGPDMVAYLDKIGIALDVIPFPDYFPEEPGAVDSRMIGPQEFDGARLGDDYFALREQAFAFKLFNRYSLDLQQSFALGTRPPGWRWVAFKLMAKYWLDRAWRRQTLRDRRLTLGAALIGRLRFAMNTRNIPLLLNTRLQRLIMDDGRVTGVSVLRDGRRTEILARKAVILATGGFEQNQEMRDRYLPIPTNVSWSQTPKGGNMGDAIVAGESIGAATESMDCFWWAPSMLLPSREAPNAEVTHQMWIDHKHPHSFCVNQLGHRFVNEGCSYDRFGLAMIEDQKKTGANTPCWMIFDAEYRRQYSTGGIMPSIATPDSRISREWWDSYIYRADSIEALARKIAIEPSVLSHTVNRFNDFAKTGNDLEFGRGSSGYDRFFGDPKHSPNPCLGPVSKGPFYALRVHLGDLGVKGGLMADANARVLHKNGVPIPGLYAVGNCSGAPFGDAYPAGGSTLGPAMVFAFVAANHINEARQL